MANPEACQVWIEQRIDEELEGQPKTGKSDRAIGREVSEEVATLFEAVVSEDAIRIRAARKRGTNVPPPEKPAVTTQSDSEKPNNQDDNESVIHGGKRERAGRQVSQKTAWKKVERILKELTEYMKKKCEIEPDISKLSKNNIRAYVDLLNSFNNEL